VKRIYVDHNATTPLAPGVLDAMLPFLRADFGNPSSLHREGRTARAALDDARVRIARLLGCRETEVIFTSGGTESDNTALHAFPTGHLIASAIEHHAVLHPARLRNATFLPANRDGIIDPDDLKNAIRPDTALVSIMSANNETGTLQPIKELAALCRQHGIPFHTDAVQSFGKEPVNVADWDVDILSLSAHKFGGPKGAGILYVRRGTKFQPLLHGGAHENERRAGTENVAAAAGMAVAAEHAVAKLPEESVRLRALTEKLTDAITSRIPGAHRNGDAVQRISNTVNFRFDGCPSESLLAGLDLEGIAASSGSACAVGSLEPSHVLLTMGLTPSEARSAVRFSLGTDNTEADVEVIVAALGRIVKRLRG
jgi:cysteine desulfurase